MMDKEYLIQERPLRALLIFSIPMMIGNLFQQFYTMADSVIVGRFVGEEALAAVGASYSLTTVFISIAIGGGIGASVLVSQAFGARDYTKMHRMIRTALITFLALSFLLGAFGFAAGKSIMVLLNTPADILDQSVVYLRIYFLGLPFLFMYNVLSAMFNALGRSRIPLFLLIFSSVFNILLDIYFVCVFSMGVAGVAWATFLAQGLSAVLAFFIFLRTLREYKGEQTDWFSASELVSMTRIALPSILQQSTVSIGMMLVQSVVNTFGAQMLAGYSAAMRIESLCIVPMSAIGNALSSYTAQNIGAGKYERVRKGYRTSYLIVGVIAAVICFILELANRPLITLFLGEEGTRLALFTGMDCTRFMGWFYALIGLKMITDGVLRGAGDMTVFTISNLVNLSLRVLFAVTFAPRFGIAMVWTAVPLGWLANYLISYLRYRTGKWQKALTADSSSPGTAS